MSARLPDRPDRTSTLAVVSLVSGILAWCALPFVGAIVAVVCGHLARGEIRRTPFDARPDGDSMAVAGLVLGYVQLLLGVLMMVAVIVSVILFGSVVMGWP